MPDIRERFRPRRRFGQNFLVNQGAIGQIIVAFRPAASDLVLEVGPGRGALTRPLLGRVERLAAVEIDTDLASALRESLIPLAPRGALQVIQADILSVDLSTLLADLGVRDGRDARVIANLPFNIATPVLLRLLEHRSGIRDLLVMIQREVAGRIVADPGGRDYGGLSVLCQVYSSVERVLRLRPGSFRPIPKVQSEVIRMVPRRPEEAGGAPLPDPRSLSRLLRVCFAQRRKTLLNNLSAFIPAGPAGAALRCCRLDPRARPETVTVAEYLALHSFLAGTGAL
jgi:16S rRNA (adenine1518-N6/adenine1519-N6)-dimethyltransferase